MHMCAVFILFLVFSPCSSVCFSYFLREDYDGPGEQPISVMRVDRSIDRDSDLYAHFGIYAMGMLVIYPLGVTCWSVTGSPSGRLTAKALKVDTD